MSNEISISHPITAKLLSGEIELKDITQEDFRRDRVIYDTLEEASTSGYEASHLIPLALQRDRYNKEHGTNYKSRREFIKHAKGEYNDQCFRYTPFEHIIDHYLGARENPEEVGLFSQMVRFNFNKLTENQQDLLNEIKEFAELRKEGAKKAQEGLKGRTPFDKGKTHKELYGDDYVEPLKGKKWEEIYDEGYTHPGLGTHKYTNGEYDIQLRDGDPVPEGFYRGSHTKGRNPKDLFGEDWVSPRKGTICYTDGINNIYLKPDETPPAGYWKGNNLKGKTAPEIYGEIGFTGIQVKKHLKKLERNNLKLKRENHQQIKVLLNVQMV